MIEESRVAAGRARERVRHRLTSGDGWSRERGAERERERERERDWILLRELQQEQHEVNLQILLWRFFCWDANGVAGAEVHLQNLFCSRVL